MLFEDLPGTRRYRRRAGSTNRNVQNDGDRLPKLSKFADIDSQELHEANYNFVQSSKKLLHEQVSQKAQRFLSPDIADKST